MEKPNPVIPVKELGDIFPLAKTYTADLHLFELEHNSGNISLIELIYISLITKLVKPKTIVEFGTFNGRTTMNLAANSPEYATVWTVDLPLETPTKYALEQKQFDPENDETGYVGFANKKFINTPLEGKITQIWEDTATFDFTLFADVVDLMFIDASHSYENCLNDSHTAYEVVKEGGWIIWHDYNGWPGVTQALNELYGQTIWAGLQWIGGTSFVILRR